MKFKKLKYGIFAATMAAMLIGITPAMVYATEADEETLDESTDSENISADEAVSANAATEVSTSANASGGEGVVVPGTITANNGKYIALSFPESYLPIGFHKSTCTYQNATIEIAYQDNGNGEVVLAYLTAADGSGGEFYLCDINTAEMSDFLQISGGDGKYIIVLNPGDTIIPPAGFTKANLQWGEKALTGWVLSSTLKGTDTTGSDTPSGADTGARLDGKYTSALLNACAGVGKTMVVHAAETVSDGSATQEEPDTALNTGGTPEDYFLIYAVNQDCVEGFYLYDKKEGTYQRYLASGSTADESAGSYKASAQKRLFVIAGLAVVLLILVFVLVNIGLQLRDYKRTYGDEEEDEEDEMEQMRRRVVSKEKSSIKTGRKELNYLMDRDDEEDDTPDWTNYEVPLKDLMKSTPAKQKLSSKPAAEAAPVKAVRQETTKQEVVKQDIPRQEAPKQDIPDVDLDEDFEFEFIDI